MDIRGIANTVSNTVNPNAIVSVKRSTGYTAGAGLKQVPSYATPVSGPAQIQALDNADLKQLDGLNLQGVLRAIYLRGSLAGVVRADSKGGDLVIIGSQTWLVVKVLESWPLWTKAAICLQDNG